MRMSRISPVRPITAGARPLLVGNNLPSAVLKKADELDMARPANQVNHTPGGVAEPSRTFLLEALTVADGQGLLRGDIRTTAALIGLALMARAPVGDELRRSFGDRARSEIQRVATVVPAVGKLLEVLS